MVFGGDTMQLFFAVDGFLTAAQQTQVAAAFVTMLIGFQPVFLAWCVWKLNEIREAQKKRYAEQDERERLQMEKHGHIHKRASDESEMATSEVRDVRAESLGGHELQEDSIPKRRRHTSPAVGALPVSDTELDDAYNKHRGAI